jgi:hypothetical protein
MSGGTFDYSQYRIHDIWEKIRSILDRQGKPRPKDELWGGDDYYKDYPQEMNYEVYPEEIQRRLREAVYYLRKAEIYAQRADWFLAGDDGEESFLRRLEQELNSLDNESA